MNSKASFDYRAKMAQLEDILTQLQDVDTPLDTAVTLHEQGKKLVVELEAYLQTAEHDIRKQVGKE